MAVPITIDNLNVVASSNSPAGSDSVTTSTGPDEYFRALSAIVRRGQGSSVGKGKAGACCRLRSYYPQVQI